MSVPVGHTYMYTRPLADYLPLTLILFEHCLPPLNFMHLSSMLADPVHSFWYRANQYHLTVAELSVLEIDHILLISFQDLQVVANT